MSSMSRSTVRLRSVLPQTSYRKNALIIGTALGILFLSCLVFLFFFPQLQTANKCTALIYQNGHLLHSIDLTTVTTPYEITISGTENRYNLIEVRPGSIGIIDANCPDKLCVHMGFQENSLLPITCLPHNVVVRIVSGLPSGVPDQPDGMTY